MHGRHKRKYNLNFCAVDFDKIHRVRDFRIRMGYSAYELSFLLGKQDFFFRDIENPLNTKRISPNDTNFLQLIFREPISTFMPAKLDVNLYHLQVTTFTDPEIEKPVYEIQIENSEEKFEYFRTIAEEEKHVELSTPFNSYTFEEVKSYIDFLMSNSYFIEPHLASEIFHMCRDHFGIDFHPRYLIQVLNYYTNKKSGDPKLDASNKNIFGRTEYAFRNTHDKK